MSYSKEMCVFLLSNPQMIEEDSLTEHVEATVFKAINTAISKRLGERSPWRTRLGLVVEDEDGNDDTVFAPLDWPTKPGHADLVVFRLTETDANANSYWLGSALGINGCTLAFEFWMDGRPAGPSRYKVKQHLEVFLKEKEVLQKAGFQFTKRGTLTLPFALDPVVVAKEYPELKKSLDPMNTALESVLKLMPEFDKFVKNTLPA
ncbi:MAG: hypothetical protein EOM56_04665 [Deltaproteobacteria bacterium]|nr:hypothetical protein [Deltaproteobacteria bacterium]